MAKKKKSATPKEEVADILVSEIRKLPGQPRTFFDPKMLEEMASSLKAAGQQLPIIVTRIEKPGKDGIRFELTDGECRWRATKMNNQLRIRAIIRPETDANQKFRDAIIANGPRTGHTALEKLEIIKRLRGMGDSVKKIAEMHGKTEPWVYQHLTVLKLEPEVLKLMHPKGAGAYTLSFLVAYMLRSIEDPKLQLQTAEKIMKMEMSHGRAKHLINKVVFAKGIKKASRHKPGKQFKVLSHFFQRNNQWLELHIDKSSDQELLKILDSRPHGEREALLREVQKSQKQASGIADILKKTFSSRR